MGWLKTFRDFFNPSPFSEKIDNVFFGLGNPGQKYCQTRHNAGFIVADAFAKSFDSVKAYNYKNACFKIGMVESKRVAVVKPLTFMNQSGTVVESVLKKMNLPLSAAIILVDDFNIPTGSIRVRKNGSSGGHNGLKSIEAFIGSDYPRLRVGVGPLPEGSNVIDFVLGQFSEHDLEMLKETVPKAVDALKSFIIVGIEATMNKFNK